MELNPGRHDLQTKHAVGTSSLLEWIGLPIQRPLPIRTPYMEIWCVVFCTSLMMPCKMEYLGILLCRWFQNPLKQLWLHNLVFLLRSVRSYRVYVFLTNFLSTFILFSTKIGGVLWTTRYTRKNQGRTSGGSTNGQADGHDRLHYLPRQRGR